MNPLTPRIRMQEDLIGMSLYAYKWDVIGRNIFKTGTYDPFLSKWLIERFKAGGGVEFHRYRRQPRLFHLFARYFSYALWKSARRRARARQFGVTQSKCRS